MKITNKEGLPEPIVKALQNDDYDKGKADYSATQLLDPPRKVMLTRRHWDEIEQDAADMLALLKGKMIHKLLEQAKVGDQIQEERLYLDVCGRVLSGQADLFDGHTISDYKNTSAWTAVYKDRWDEWEAQLNIYASLFEAAGFKVGAVQIVALYGDWSATEALRSPDYPQHDIQVLKFKLWEPEIRKAFIEGRMNLMIQAEDMHDDELPECGKREMWETDPVWAVMKEGQVRSKKNCTTEDQALTFVADQPEKERAKLSIVLRPGERRRCNPRYCPACVFCNQYKKYKEATNAHMV